MSSALIVNQVKAPFKGYSGLLLRSPNKKYLVDMNQNVGLIIKKSSLSLPNGRSIWSNSVKTTDQNAFTMNIQLSKEGNLAMFSKDGA